MRYRYKKASILATGLVLIVLLIGCGEEKKIEETKKQVEVDEVLSPKIEISANENAQEVKVAVKERNESQSKSYYYDYNIKSEYDANAKPANKDAGVRAKPRSTIDANINIRSPYEKIQISMMTQKLSKTFRIKCSACHDDYANGIIGPSLLSRDSDYIYNAIADFKSGKKSNPLMDDLIHMMSDEEIRTLADEIYLFNQKIKEMKEKK